ncbi:MAG: response regulator [Nitrospirota bacterium]|nr:response regulator [Nitrospirota bacterium]
MKVLVIEDNPTNMKLAVEILSLQGHEVLQADEAETGLEMAALEQPGLILMDIQLPGIDGLTATKRLKGDSRTSHIRVIALTAFAMKGDEEKMIQAGCDAYVSKPIRYKEFLETLKRFT